MWQIKRENATFVMVRVRYASKIELKYGTLVRYGSRCEVRSTQILNVPYCTAILRLVTTVHGEKSNFQFFSIILILNIFSKKLRGFLFELIDFGLEESAVGERTVTFMLSQFLEIGTKHAQTCREPTMTS